MGQGYFIAVWGSGIWPLREVSVRIRCIFAIFLPSFFPNRLYLGSKRLVFKRTKPPNVWVGSESTSELKRKFVWKCTIHTIFDGGRPQQCKYFKVDESEMGVPNFFLVIRSLWRGSFQAQNEVRTLSWWGTVSTSTLNGNVDFVASQHGDLTANFFSESLQSGRRGSITSKNIKTFWNFKMKSKFWKLAIFEWKTSTVPQTSFGIAVEVIL